MTYFYLVVSGIVMGLVAAVPIGPVNLICIRWMACLASDARAPTLPLEWKGNGKYAARATMTNKEVSFVDANASAVRIELR